MTRIPKTKILLDSHTILVHIHGNCIIHSLEYYNAFSLIKNVNIVFGEYILDWSCIRITILLKIVSSSYA